SSRILSVVVDEAHVVSHWGAGFRKQYGKLGEVRALLPAGVPFVAMSATLPTRVRRDVLTKLEFGKKYVDVNIGNDRPNVSIAVRAIENTLTSYRDLDFIIPKGCTDVQQIAKTFLYADNVIKGTDIEDHLRELLSEELRMTGAIRTYSAASSKDYLKEVMRLFRLGIVRILICTDAAGMGCDLPDVDLVVQWKLPVSVSTFIQRAGRAARDPTRVGLAVLLVEKAAYEVDVAVQKAAEAAGKSKTKKKSKKTVEKKAKAGKEFAEAHGSNRGSHDGKKDAILTRVEPPLDPEALDEGLYVLIQTGICRRKVLTKIYANQVPNPTTACCDLCNPELLDRIRPAPPLKTPRQSTIKKGTPAKSVQQSLHAWRTLVFKRDFRRSLFGPSGILRDETVELLASVGPIRSRQVLEKVLAGQWSWYEQYGDELLSCLLEMEMPNVLLKPKKPRGTKRAATAAPADAPAPSRARTTATTIAGPSGSANQTQQPANLSVMVPHLGYHYAPPTNYWQPGYANHMPQPAQPFHYLPQQFPIPHFPSRNLNPPPMAFPAPHPYQHLTPGAFTFSVPLQAANSSNSAANRAPSDNPYRHLAPTRPQPPDQSPRQ
ncbi:P-loop containing nucleoside triphosphate hydrolase protein, partial [Mycena floridula]